MTSEDVTELLPCPFCGGAAEKIVSPEPGLYATSCSECSASTGQYLTVEEVADAWNRRSEAALTTLSATIEELRTERDAARNIVRDIYWMALRYADGRKSYAVGMCNDAVQKGYDGGWLKPKTSGGDPITPYLARDGMGPEWVSIEARALAAESQLTELREALHEAEAVMSIVEPRSGKREYLAALDRIRAAAIRSRSTGDVDG